MLTNTWISIIVVTWNSSKYIHQLLDSLNKQTRLPQEIIFVDNGSDDFDVLEAALSENCNLHHRLIPLFQNTGFAAANNTGIQHCQNADFVVLLNPDAFPDSAWLEKLIVASEKYPHISFFSSRQMQPGGILLDGAGDELMAWGKPYRRGHGKPLQEKYMHDSPVFSACAAAAMYKKVALLKVGGFDEDFFCYVEDVDLAFRLQLQGYRCMYVADAVVTHIGSASLGKRSDFAIYYGQRNLIFCFFKNMPFVAILLFMPWHLFANFIYLIGSIFIGKFNIVFLAKKDALRNTKSIWLKRKLIQKHKGLTFLELVAVFLRAFINR